MWRFVFLLSVMVSVPTEAAENIVIGRFADGDLSGWQEKVFKEKTAYNLIEKNGTTVLKAESNASASGLFREQAIDLRQTPCLQWRWKVEDVLSGLDETSKAGDDYAARVYVVVSIGPMFWQTRAISYVWSNTQPQGRDWPNAYTNKAHMLAVQSHLENVGMWVQERRDVRADFKTYFDLDVSEAQAIALMTDTDDSGQSATAYYGDIELSSSCG